MRTLLILPIPILGLLLLSPLLGKDRGAARASDVEVVLEEVAERNFPKAELSEVEPIELEEADPVVEETEPTEEERQEELIENLTRENRFFEETLKRELREEVAEARRIQTELQLQEQRLKAELSDSERELQRMQTELRLRRAALEEELLEFEEQNRRLTARIEAQQNELQAETAALETERKRIAAERAVAEEKLRVELFEMQAQKERLGAENALRQQQLAVKESEVQEMQLDLQKEMMKLDLATKRLMTRQQEEEVAIQGVDADVRLIRKKREKERTVDELIQYPADPFENGVLRVSDRRIPLNGPIISGTADYVTRRIHFFNNKDPEAPIFIVIDSCPGGSVMEGYRILKAMQASDAPVHVVVKSFAASMAAIITTWADRSYAFPNAIILHHQPMTGAYGNVTQQREALENLEEWAHRVLTPVAEKMDMSLEELYNEMYENSSTGDWQEFADKAVALKWVNSVVYELREEGVVEQPNDAAPVPWFFRIFYGDASGVEVKEMPKEFPKQLQLPPLQPFDAYFIHNPDGLYVW